MKKIIERIKVFVHFLRFDIWRVTTGELSKSKTLLYYVLKTIYLSIRGFSKEKLNIRAAALTYSIMFAIVPLIALISAVAHGFRIENTIENMLNDTFVGQANLMPLIMDFVRKYLDTMSGGIFLGIGLAILVFSVFNLFSHIELALNNIWQVEKSRSFVKQFTLYFSGVLIFPLLIAISSGLSIYINNILKGTFIFQVFTPFIQFSISIVPYFVSALIFTLMYLIVPNTKVRFMNALLAGIIAGFVFQAFQSVYVSGQINLTRYNAIYGGFAAIPLLLLWINISCLIFLVGAEISYTSQNLRNFDYLVDSENISDRYKNNLTYFVAFIIVKRFEKNAPPLTVEEIVSEYKMPIRIVNQIVGILKQADIISEINLDNGVSVAYQPAVDINQLTLNLLQSKVETKGSELFLESKSEEMDHFWQQIIALQEKRDEIFNEILVKDILG
jgi:membrane protein